MNLLVYVLNSCTSSILFEFTVKSNKASQFENGIKGLLRKLRAPVPSTRQSTIDTRTFQINSVRGHDIHFSIVDILVAVFTYLHRRNCRHRYHQRHFERNRRGYRCEELPTLQNDLIYKKQPCERTRHTFFHSVHICGCTYLQPYQKWRHLSHTTFRGFPNKRQ